MGRLFSCFGPSGGGGDDDDDRNPEKPSPAILPDLVLHSIAMRLSSTPDYFAFTGVCRDWRSVAKFALPDFVDSHPPMLAIHTEESRCLPARFYSLTTDDDKMIHSYKRSRYWTLGREYAGQSHGYLILTDRTVLSYVSVLNPFTGTAIVFPRKPKRLFVHFGLLSAPAPAPPTSPDCHLMLFGPDTSLLYCCMGASKRWNQRQYFKGLHFDCALVINNKVYAVATCHSELTLLEIGLPPEPNLLARYPGPETAISPGIGRRRSVLVQLDGELLIVIFAVGAYRLDFATKEWVKLNSLGDRALFVSRYACEVRHSGRAKGVDKNCIYWADQTLLWYAVFTMDGKLKKVFGANRARLGPRTTFWISPPRAPWL